MGPAAPPPLDLAVPHAYEANPGIVAGTAPRGATAILVVSDGKGVRRFKLRRNQKEFSFGPIGLPPGDHVIEVRAMKGRKPIAATSVSPVLGLPRRSFQIRPTARTDGAAQRMLGHLGAPGGAVYGAWVRDLRSGRAASYNAGATFPAASTLKLAILMTSLARFDDDPVTSGRFGSMQRMILDSSNRAANEVLSTFGGGHVVNGFVRDLGGTGSDMYGGYLLEPGERRALRRSPRTAPPPVTVVQQPSYPYGKHTSPHDLGLMATSLVQAAAGYGPAWRLGVSRREARVALWLLGHARYAGLVQPSTRWVVAHKAGWLPRLQHDAAIAFPPTGPVVVVVMSDAPSGVSYITSRAWAARVWRIAMQRLAAG